MSVDLETASQTLFTKLNVKKKRKKNKQPTEMSTSCMSVDLETASQTLFTKLNVKKKRKKNKQPTEMSTSCMSVDLAMVTASLTLLHDIEHLENIHI